MTDLKLHTKLSAQSVDTGKEGTALFAKHELIALAKLLKPLPKSSDDGQREVGNKLLMLLQDIGIDTRNA